MKKPTIEKGDTVKIPKGYLGVVARSWHDESGWWAVIGVTPYRHEELEVVNRARPRQEVSDDQP